MSKLKNGSVGKIKTVKAGCGIRYDPDQIDDSVGFDFSMAEDMKPKNDKQNESNANEPNAKNPYPPTNSPSLGLDD